MLKHLVQREILLRFRDLRFLVLLGMSALLGPASVMTGVDTYRLQLREYDEASAFRRQAMAANLDSGNLTEVGSSGYTWNRPPEKLLPFVNGLSGATAREGKIQEMRRTQKRVPLHFESSPFEMNPAHRLFGTLDIAFLAEIVLSIAAFILVFDVICGEKEAGTLRLLASFPVPRSTIAFAKLIAGSLTVWMPLGMLFLLAALTASLSNLGLSSEDWWRLLSILVLFLLYLTVFVAFGLWGSAVTHRRSTSFLLLLCLWGVWVYLVPSVILRSSIITLPAQDFYTLEGTSQRLRWEIAGRLAERDDLQRSQRERSASRDFYNQMVPMVVERDNRLAGRQELLSFLSALSPLASAHLTAMDLAGTGWRKQHRIKRAFREYREYFVNYIWENDARRFWDNERNMWVGKDGMPFKLPALTPFVFKDNESAAERISGNANGFLWLGLLSILGFAGAFRSILQYDVR